MKITVQYMEVVEHTVEFNAPDNPAGMEEWDVKEALDGAIASGKLKRTSLAVTERNINEYEVGPVGAVPEAPQYEPEW